MGRTEALQGVRMAVFLNVLDRWESAELNQEEAAELLGVSERTFRRWTRRYEEEGERLYRERYQGFTVKHFHEHLVQDHGFGWGYTWTKLHLQWMGVVAKAPRKGAHRRKRERRPLPGTIYSAFLTEEEGTASTFRALKEVFGKHGLPMSLYTDRGAHYFHTPKAGGEIDRGHPTQVGRALEQLGVEHIGAYSPQARGRSERAFGTLQDRLVNELALAGITDIAAANAFLREVYLPAHNARFAVLPAGEGSAFTPIPGVDLDEILCVEEERQVGHDNCVSYRTLKLQIPQSPMRPHFVKARVKVHIYLGAAHSRGRRRLRSLAPATRCGRACRWRSAAAHRVQHRPPEPCIWAGSPRDAPAASRPRGRPHPASLCNKRPAGCRRARPPARAQLPRARPDARRAAPRSRRARSGSPGSSPGNRCGRDTRCSRRAKIGQDPQSGRAALLPRKGWR